MSGLVMSRDGQEFGLLDIYPTHLVVDASLAYASVGSMLTVDARIRRSLI